MNWHMSIAAISRIAAVLAVTIAVHGQTLTAQVPLGDPLRPDLSIGDRTSFGLTAGVGIPRGEFDEVAGVGFELIAHVLVVNTAGWLGLRVAGAGAFYREAGSPVTGIGRVSARSRMATLDIGPQLIVPDGTVRPYGYATFGGTFALTDPSVESGIYSVSETPAYSELTHVFKVGGGLYLPLTAGERSISLDLGAHYRRNGDTRFLRADGVTLVQPGEVGLSPIALNAELLVLSLGVALGL
jgi:hypothetical protein